MTSHYEGRIHWNKLFSLIKENGIQGIAIYELAEKLGVDKNDDELEKAIEQLLRQGRIRACIGTWEGKICRFVQKTKDT